MEEENRGFLNSPIIHNNTPIKRLGLSRKRKSRGPPYNLNAKIQIYSEKISDNCTQSDKFLSVKKANDSFEDVENEEDKSVNYDEEIQSLKNRITENEEKLKILQCNKTKISQLEDLIELWKNGCKSALLHFNQLLKKNQTESVDLKVVLSKLGIWETILENFGDDPDVPLSE